MRAAILIDVMIIFSFIFSIFISTNTFHNFCFHWIALYLFINKVKKQNVIENRERKVPRKLAAMAS